MRVPVVVLAFALIGAGCSVGPNGGISGSPAARPTPSQSLFASATEAEQTASPTARAPGGLATDHIAEVVTNDLVVRSLPEISPASSIDPVQLSDGKLLFVLDGPVTADGYDWYRVAPFDATLNDTPDPAPRLGWVAAGKDAERWIAPWAGQCRTPTVTALRHMPLYLRVGCFGDAELTLEGNLGDCSYVVPGTVSPSWLTTEFCELYEDDYQGELVGPFTFHVPTEEPLVKEGKSRPVRVTGHFDDQAAEDCEEHPLEGYEPQPAELIILACRGSFVVTRIDQAS